MRAWDYSQASVAHCDCEVHLPCGGKRDEMGECGHGEDDKACECKLCDACRAVMSEAEAEAGEICFKCIPMIV